MCPCPDCSYDGPEGNWCDWCGEPSDTDICPACQYRYECEQEDNAIPAP